MHRAAAIGAVHAVLAKAGVCACCSGCKYQHSRAQHIHSLQTCCQQFLEALFPVQAMSGACGAAGWSELSAVVAALAGMAWLDSEPAALLTPLCQVGWAGCQWPAAFCRRRRKEE